MSSQDPFVTPTSDVASKAIKLQDYSDSESPAGHSTHREQSSTAGDDTDTNYLSNDIGDTSIDVEKFNKTYLPMITETYGTIHKAKQSERYKPIISSLPEIHFNKKDMAAFITWYIHIKENFIECAKDTYDDPSKVFTAFEEFNLELQTKVDSGLVDDLYFVFTEVTKSSKNKTAVIFRRGQQDRSVFQLLENVRKFHCGNRSMPLSYSDMFKVIVYGDSKDSKLVTHDNTYAVRIHIEILDCLTLFHPSIKDFTPQGQAVAFIDNMDATFRNKFTEHMKRAATGVFKSLTQSFKNLEEVLESIEGYYDALNYDDDRIEFHSMQIPRTVRLANEANKSIDGKANQTNKIGDGKGVQNTNGKSVASKSEGKNKNERNIKNRTIKVSASHIGDDPNDLNARPWAN